MPMAFQGNSRSLAEDGICISINCVLSGLFWPSSVGLVCSIHNDSRGAVCSADWLHACACPALHHRVAPSLPSRVTGASTAAILSQHSLWRLRQSRAAAPELSVRSHLCRFATITQYNVVHAHKCYFIRHFSKASLYACLTLSGTATLFCSAHCPPPTPLRPTSSLTGCTGSLCRAAVSSTHASTWHGHVQWRSARTGNGWRMQSGWKERWQFGRVQVSIGWRERRHSWQILLRSRFFLLPFRLGLLAVGVGGAGARLCVLAMFSGSPPSRSLSRSSCFLFRPSPASSCAAAGAVCGLKAKPGGGGEEYSLIGLGIA